MWNKYKKASMLSTEQALLNTEHNESWHPGRHRGVRFKSRPAAQETSKMRFHFREPQRVHKCSLSYGSGSDHPENTERRRGRSVCDKSNQRSS